MKEENNKALTHKEFKGGTVEIWDSEKDCLKMSARLNDGKERLRL